MAVTDNAINHEVLLVDDESYYAQYYIGALEREFRVYHCKSALEALEFIRSSTSLKSIVLDVMMPPSHQTESYEIGDGHDTGLHLLHSIADIVRDRRLPVLLLSNRDSTELEETISEYDLPKGLITVLAKTEVEARQLPRIVLESIERWQTPFGAPE